MSSAQIPEVARSRLLMAIGAGASVVVATGLGQWKAALGLATGFAAMAGAVELARLRSARLEAAAHSSLARMLQGLIQMTKYLVAIAVFWVELNVLRVPAWSVFVGVTVAVACMVAAFAMRADKESTTSPKIK